MNGANPTTFDPADPANKAETEALLARDPRLCRHRRGEERDLRRTRGVQPAGRYRIYPAPMHYGCKRAIVRCLVKRGCKVTVMPAFATAEQIKALAPDGIMLSNGPVATPPSPWRSSRTSSTSLS